VVAPVEDGWPMKSQAGCPVEVVGPMGLQALLEAQFPG